MLKLVLLLIATVVAIAQLASAHKVGHERRDHRCGPTVNCSLCGHGRCCSAGGYCGDGIEYCGGESCAYQCPYDTPTCKPKPCAKSYHSDDSKDTGVTESVVRDLSGGREVDCAAVNRVNMSMGWIQEHGPTVFCGRKPAVVVAAESNGTMGTSHACGKCLKVTKRETGTQTIVRLSEDECSRKGPILGNAIFQELDTDGKGAALGYLTVEYQSVPCDED